MKFIKNHFHLLNADAVSLGNSWNFINVISPYYRLYYIEDGAGFINSPAGCTTLTAGNLFLIPSFTLCDLHCDGHLSQYFIQFFEESPDGISLFGHCREILSVPASGIDIHNFKRLLEINPGRGINRSDNPKVYEKDVYYKEYTKLNELQTASTQFETQGIILQLLSRFMKSERFGISNQEAIPSAVLAAISYIQINIAKPLKVSQLASDANLNTDYFSRIFHRYAGKSPVNFILEKRIERAQYLIITTNIQYGEIAKLTGFENQQYFSRIFKKITGLSPKEYRNQSPGY
ncbi:helix-turn-helix transcriptional regulator [Agrobacterium tumefaciens]|nr:helix-turn-helix transcriptional regulator [Agrobacterium tumefaciens]NTE25234.1 helix-turn-helix transcriptional regulator [Agrobacterium tumefaciens]